MTKLEICERERTNPGQVYLYPEGAFYKAYGVSAWVLCEKVYPFKVSVRALKGLDGALLSVGFPISSLEKFTSGAEVRDDDNGHGKVVRFPGGTDVSGYEEWASSFSFPAKSNESAARPFDSLPVYGIAYRLAVELTAFASRLDKNYRYSLGEDIRRSSKSALLCISLAGKGEERVSNIHSARISTLDVQLSLRLLNDLKVLPDKRYVYFLELTEDMVKQLSNWERSERRRSPAGVPSP